MRPSGMQGLWDPVLCRSRGCAWGEAGGLFFYEDRSAVTALSLAVCGHPGPCREGRSAV